LGGPGFESWYRTIYSSLFHNVQTGSGVQSQFGKEKYTNLWVPAFLPGVKWPGIEDDRSPPSNAEVMNVWIHTASSYVPS